MSEGQEPMNMIENMIESEPVVEAQLESRTVPESQNAPTDLCQDDGDEDIEPLLGKPFFHIEIAKSHVGDVWHKYQLVIPAEFARTLPNKPLQVSLTRGGRTWEMNCLCEIRPTYRRFDMAWKAFAKDNMLKVGDVCIFELMESSDTALKFKVRILRGDFPSALLDKHDGTTENPIVLD